MTRGAGWFAPLSVLARKRSAAAASRLADRRKSIVAPVESTARYRPLALNPDVGLVHTEKQNTRCGFQRQKGFRSQPGTIVNAIRLIECLPLEEAEEVLVEPLINTLVAAFT